MNSSSSRMLANMTLADSAKCWPAAGESCDKMQSIGLTFGREEKAFFGADDCQVLKQADLGTPVAELRLSQGVPEQSCYRWKKIHGGMAPPEARECNLPREECIKHERPVA